MCHSDWSDFALFLKDHHLTFQGYQAHPREPLKGLFLFNHQTNNCETTLSISVDKFSHNLSDQLTKFSKSISFQPFTPHGEGCPGHCAVETNLEPCPNGSCNGKIIRDLMQIIKKEMSLS
jgi:hypothetical protein